MESMDVEQSNQKSINERVDPPLKNTHGFRKREDGFVSKLSSPQSRQLEHQPFIWG